MLHATYGGAANVALDAANIAHAPTRGMIRVSYGLPTTVTVDGQDQMDRVGRFLGFLGQMVAASRKSSHGRTSAYWKASQRLQRRKLPRRSSESDIPTRGFIGWCWNRIMSAAEHESRWHWLLMDAPHQWNQQKPELAIQTPVGPYFAKIGVLDGESADFNNKRKHFGSPRLARSYYNYRSRQCLLP